MSNRTVASAGEYSAGCYAVGRTAFSFYWHPIEPLEQQEAIVQLAEAIHHCNVEGGGVSSCAIENVCGLSVPVTSRF